MAIPAHGVMLAHRPRTSREVHRDAAGFEIATPTPLGFLAGILPAAVLYAWVYNNTGRSVLAVILFHFMQNFSGEILSMSVPARVWQVGLMWGAAALVVWWWGRATLARRLSRPPDRAGPSPSVP